MPIEAPPLTPDLKRAHRYRRIKLALYATRLMSSVAFNGWLALSGTSARTHRAIRCNIPDSGFASLTYLAALSGGRWLTRLPLSYVSGHLVERAFGLTNQTGRGWLIEQAKAGVLGTVFNVPLTAAAFAVIRRRPNDWWLVLSGILIPATLLATRLAPVLIAPLFNRFESLDDPELTSRITALGERAGVRIVDVYRMDMSQQTEKANAYFTGLGKSQRIVLADTLLDRFRPDEVEGIVAHELGHQVHGDVWRLVGMFSGVGFGVAYALHRLAPGLIRSSQRRTGIQGPGDVTALPLYSLVMTGIGMTLQPLQAAVSRRIERRTDDFALTLTGDGTSYARAMERLTIQNLDDPDPPRWLIWYAYTHPPAVERIATARAFAMLNPHNIEGESDSGFALNSRV